MRAGGPEDCARDVVLRIWPLTGSTGEILNAEMCRAVYARLPQAENRPVPLSARRHLHMAQCQLVQSSSKDLKNFVFSAFVRRGVIVSIVIGIMLMIINYSKYKGRNLPCDKKKGHFRQFGWRGGWLLALYFMNRIGFLGRSSDRFVRIYPDRWSANSRIRSPSLRFPLGRKQTLHWNLPFWRSSVVAPEYAIRRHAHCRLEAGNCARDCMITDCKVYVRLKIRRQLAASDLPIHRLGVKVLAAIPKRTAPAYGDSPYFSLKQKTR
ncbi:hypothetical protein uav_175 [Pseudomonas phage UAVern]|uniref:Uncharacterized protein n=1 Tax=Pseudomonas phage UAVern TaxID=2856997 RepID=A0A975UUC9_9CAUD|nr:hypothetical protein uav_175 [Pseudomonas phage UAVern]